MLVQTHKKQEKEMSIGMPDLTRCVDLEAGMDFDLVYYIKNYVSYHSNWKNGSNVSNDFDTHCQTVSIVRECLDTARLPSGSL